MRAVLRGGIVDKTALREDYLEELLRVGRRPGYSTVARSVYASLPSFIDARSGYSKLTAPVHLIYGEKDWSRMSDRKANKDLIHTAKFTQVPNAGHFIALERPDVPASLLG
jgi:pimeloyl-ACP methyl ester carboxylesterase